MSLSLAKLQGLQELQNPKQNHKTQNRIAKPKTESQNPKQNRKTQNRITKPKTESQIPISPGFSEIHKVKQLLRKYTEREIKQCMQKKYLPHCFWIKFLCWKTEDRGGVGGGREAKKCLISLNTCSTFRKRRQIRLGKSEGRLGAGLL